MSQQYFNSITNQAKKEIKSKLNSSYGQDKQRLENISKTLTAILYKEKDIENKYEKIRSQIEKNVAEYLDENIGKKMNQKIDGFDYSTFTAKSGENKGVIQITGYDSFEHKERIDVKTLIERFNAIRQNIGNITKISEFNKTENEINQLLKEVSTLITNWGKTEEQADIRLLKGKEIPIINLQKNENATNTIKKLDELWKQITFLGAIKNVNLIGSIFEHTLNIFKDGIENTIEQTCEACVEEYFKEKTAGSKLVNRGYFSKEETKKYGDITSTYKSLFDEKSGKMDVLIEDRTEASSFLQISAKNWQSSENRDFGTTSIAGAMVRSLGIEPTINFGRASNTKKTSKTQLDEARRMARLAIISDIVMGYSQREAFVNTIIINDRKDKEVKVFSVYDLIFGKDDERFNQNEFYGEDFSKVKAGFLPRGVKHTPDVILQALSALKVTVKSNLIKNM